MTNQVAAIAAEPSAPGPRWGPPDGSGEFSHWGERSSEFFPALHFVGVSMLLLLALFLAFCFFMARRNGRGPWAPRHREAPETGAQRVLAERFAKGDISVEEFLERASVLNWTPGADSGRGRR